MGHVQVEFQPQGVRVTVPPGTSVSDAAIAAGLELYMPCGGEGRCGKCKVVCRNGKCSDPTGAELEALSAQELQAGFRLACQTKISEDAVIQIPLSSRLRGKRILEEISARPVELAPNVRRVTLVVDPPNLETQNDDLHRVAQALGWYEGAPEVVLRAARALPEAVRAADGALTVTLLGDKIVEVQAGRTERGVYGLALDVGTTTVVGYLVDLATGKRVATASALNRQHQFGADLVSRVEFSNEEPHGKNRLRRAVLEVVNEIVVEAARLAGVALNDIYEVTVVGNACMHHMLLGLDTRHIAATPYVAVMRQAACFSSRELGIRINPRGSVYVLPLVAGWVGADTVGVMMASRLCDAEQPTMAIDLGTNGEIVLWTGERLLACSAAAGPAFEGAQIKQGMRAAEGAIEHVEVEGGDVVCHTIAGAKAVGICGSGLLDAVAQLLELGVLEQSGRLDDEAKAQKLPPQVAKRLRGEGPRREFVLAWPEESAVDSGVVLTQADIRQVQLAKGAIRAGAEVLLAEAGLTAGQLSAILLAGAFGSYINPASALRVGLVPEVPVEAVRGIGNAAGAGAVLALLSVEERQYAQEIARRTAHLELSTRADFQELFMEAMMFP